MKVYRTDEIRNVVLLGNGGSGKTSLAEAMAYVSGATNRILIKRNRRENFQSVQL